MGVIIDLLVIYSFGMLITFVIPIILYILQSKFLNKFNMLVYGTSTILAWIPIANLYLFGKLAINKYVGWALTISYFLIGNSRFYFVIYICIFIYAIVKYNKLKKRKNYSTHYYSQQQTNSESNINNLNISNYNSIQNQNSNNNMM